MSSSWQELITKAQDQVAKGKLEDAQGTAMQALAEAESFSLDDRRQGIALELLTAILYQRKQYQLSEPFSCRLLEMYKRCLGPDHLDTGTIMHNVALLYHGWGKLEQADKYYLQAVRVKSAILGSDHPDIQILTGNYAALRSVLVPLENAIKAKAPVATMSDTLSFTGQFKAADTDFLL